MSTALHAGFAEIDISPPMGTQIGGDIGRPRPTEEIRAPIFARAAVFQQGGTKVCVLSLDLLCMDHVWADRIRDQAAARFGFDRRAVMVHCSQTHSAPALGDNFIRRENPIIPPALAWLRGGAPGYDAETVEKCMQAIGHAVKALQPVQLFATRGVEARVAYNRRFITRDGKSVTHAHGGRDNVLCIEGPIDPEVGLLQCRTMDGRPTGMLLHYSSHPTFGYPKRFISPDWPGFWAGHMKDFTGGQAIAMVINGCCGNIYPHDCLHNAGPATDEAMAQTLAETSRRLAEQLKPIADAPLRFASMHIELPLRELDPSVLAGDRALLAKHPTPQWRTDDPSCVEWEWLYAVGRDDLDRIRRERPTFSYEIQTFRLGDLALLALIGEPFVEGQLNIKLESPATFTFVAHMSNGYAGYIPTSHGLRGGGYESRPSMGSRYAGEALQLIVENSVKLIAGLFDQPSRQPIMHLPV